MRIRIASQNSTLAEVKKNIRPTQDWDLKTRSMIQSVLRCFVLVTSLFYFFNEFGDDNLRVSNEEKY